MIQETLLLTIYNLLTLTMKRFYSIYLYILYFLYIYYLHFPHFQLVAGNIWFWSIWLPDFSVKKFSLTSSGPLQVLSDDDDIDCCGARCCEGREVLQPDPVCLLLRHADHHLRAARRLPHLLHLVLHSGNGGDIRR